MLLQISLYSLIVLRVLWLNLVAGSVDISDIKAFDFFWSRSLKQIREECDQTHDNFLRTLKHAIDDNENCQIVMEHWKTLKTQEIKNRRTFFKRNCNGTSLAAGDCWHTILTYMETCYQTRIHLDRDRINLLPNFLGAMCFHNNTIDFPNLYTDDFGCVNKYLRHELEGAVHRNETNENKSFIIRSKNCRMLKAYYKCSYMKAENPKDLQKVYKVADQIMDRIYNCNTIAENIAETVKKIEKILLDELLTDLRNQEPN